MGFNGLYDHYSTDHGSAAAKIGNNTVTTAHYNDTITLALTPDEKYMLSSVSVNGTSLSPTDNVYSFRMPAGNVTITAEFINKIISYTGADGKSTQATTYTVVSSSDTE